MILPLKESFTSFDKVTALLESEGRSQPRVNPVVRIFFRKSETISYFGFRLKKLSAIWLLALFTFNLVGYRGFFSYIEQQHAISLEAGFDRNAYHNNELTEISMPLSMPYLSNESGFERVDGEINLHGKTYKYVKRKVTHGRLVLLCLPDTRKQQIESAKNEFAGKANQLPSQGKQSPEQAKKVIPLADYDDATCKADVPLAKTSFTKQVAPFSPYLSQGFFTTTGQPPEMRFA